MNCQQCSTLLYDYFDNELDGPDRSAVAQHIASCPVCQRELAEIKRSAELYRQTITSVQISENFTASTLARLEENNYGLATFLPLVLLAFSTIMLLTVLLVIYPLLLPLLSLIYELTTAILPVAIIILGAFPLAKLITIALLLTIITLASWAMRRKMLY